MKRNILSVSNEVVGGFVKELIGLFEKDFKEYKKKGNPKGITSKDVVTIASKYGLTDCGYQIYMLALGLYCGSIDGLIPKFDRNMKWCRECGEAAQKLANELEVPINEIDAMEALMYYESKK